MFGKLRNKLKNWLGKPEDDKEEKDKKEEKQVIEKTPPKAKKEKTPEKQAKEETKKTQKELIKSEEPTPKSSTEAKPEEPVQETKPEQSEKQEALEKEQVKEDSKEEKPKKGLFSKLTSKFTTSKIQQEQLDDVFEDLELILLENNVALEVIDKIKESLSESLVGSDIKKSDLTEKITNSLKQAISDILLEPENLVEKIKSSSKPFTIVFFGINGSGKTTSVAKLAHKLKENKLSVALAAGDTFRAASIEQLETHAKNLDLPIIKSQYGADPTSVAFDAKKYAEKNKLDCVLIDTAGRMYTKENLIKQMEKIIRIIQPDLKIFVAESITGNDAIQQAKTFNEAVGIDGIILSKSDVDEKGGTALSVSHITKKPIYFLGTGQNYPDLEDFKKDKILKNLGLN